MEKLTLENILPYSIGYEGVKLHHFDAEREFISVCVIAELSEDEAVITDNEHEYAENIAGLLPILYPMDLTKPIMVDGKEIIPIVELAKIAFEGIEFENWLQGDRAISKEIEKSKRIRFWYLKKDQSFQTTLCGKQHVTNQIVLFQWLFKHKFDVFGLIEKGLAIDVNTLATNPYN